MSLSDPLTIDAKQSHVKRRWARYPADGAVILVRAGNIEFEAYAVDESIGGLGMETHDSVALVAGQVIQLTYRDEQTRGQVTSVVPNTSGGCRISISWEEKEQLSDDARQLAFFQFGPVTVVCDIEADCGDRQTSITLWDGKRFEVAVNQLAHRTRQARLVELQTMGDSRQVIARLYDLDTQGSADGLSQRIVEFEFGRA